MIASAPTNVTENCTSIGSELLIASVINCRSLVKRASNSPGRHLSKSPSGRCMMRANIRTRRLATSCCPLQAVKQFCPYEARFAATLSRKTATTIQPRAARCAWAGSFKKSPKTLNAWVSESGPRPAITPSAIATASWGIYGRASRNSRRSVSRRPASSLLSRIRNLPPGPAVHRHVTVVRRNEGFRGVLLFSHRRPVRRHLSRVLEDDLRDVPRLPGTLPELPPRRANESPRRRKPQADGRRRPVQSGPSASAAAAHRPRRGSRHRLAGDARDARTRLSALAARRALAARAAQVAGRLPSGGAGARLQFWFGGPVLRPRSGRPYPAHRAFGIAADRDDSAGVARRLGCVRVSGPGV